MSTSSNGVREALSRRPALSTSTSFRAAAAIAFLVFAANAAVSPLYRIYQAKFGFSATTLTLLFAVYIAVLLLTPFCCSRSCSSAPSRTTRAGGR
jgi:hypothetical protein